MFICTTLITCSLLSNLDNLTCLYVALHFFFYYFIALFKFCMVNCMQYELFFCFYEDSRLPTSLCYGNVLPDLLKFHQSCVSHDRCYTLLWLPSVDLLGSQTWKTFWTAFCCNSFILMYEAIHPLRTRN